MLDASSGVLDLGVYLPCLAGGVQNNKIVMPGLVPGMTISMKAIML
jgi:hypothetical protein